MDFLKKLLKAAPWAELEKNFELTMHCEVCGFETNDLFTGMDEELQCRECAEANDRRIKLKQSEEEFKKALEVPRDQD